MEKRLGEQCLPPRRPVFILAYWVIGWRSVWKACNLDSGNCAKGRKTHDIPNKFFRYVVVLVAIDIPCVHDGASGRSRLVLRKLAVIPNLKQKIEMPLEGIQSVAPGTGADMGLNGAIGNRKVPLTGGSLATTLYVAGAPIDNTNYVVTYDVNEFVNGRHGNSQDFPPADRHHQHGWL